MQKIDYILPRDYFETYYMRLTEDILSNNSEKENIFKRIKISSMKHSNEDVLHKSNLIRELCIKNETSRNLLNYLKMVENPFDKIDIQNLFFKTTTIINPAKSIKQFSFTTCFDNEKIDEKSFIALKYPKSEYIVKKYDLFKKSINMLSNNDVSFNLNVAEPIASVSDLNQEYEYIVIPYYGYNLEDLLLHSNEDKEIKRAWIRKSFELFKKMLEKGFFWRGFAPRNICITKIGQKYNFTLIDPEKFQTNYNQKNIDGRFLYLWWNNFLREYSLIDELDWLLKLFINSKIEKLDEFETEWIEYEKYFEKKLSENRNQSEISLEIMKEICKIEKFHNYNNKIIKGDKIGQFTGDFLDYKEEVFFFKWLLSLEKTLTSEYFFKLLFLFESAMVINHLKGISGNSSQRFFFAFFQYLWELAINNKNDLKRVLDEIETNNNYLSESFFCELMDKKMSLMKSINERKTIIFEFLNKPLVFFEKVTKNNDSLLITCLAYAKKIMGEEINKNEISIIGRGTYGLGITAPISDIDFEVHSRNNNLMLEKIISYILYIFKIDSEGSWARPREKHYILYNDTREFEEAFELRHIYGSEENIKKIQQQLINQYCTNFDRRLCDKNKVHLNMQYDLDLKECLVIARRIHRWFYTSANEYPETFPTWLNKIMYSNKKLFESISWILEIRNKLNYFKGTNVLNLTRIEENGSILGYSKIDFINRTKWSLDNILTHYNRILEKELLKRF
ncbi:hypothetical protein [Metabacillus fastidiosus]|uniref:hypothetical protein n=1 Tax=Metabacillus fastidiosus TaxID=1458 RepID=UPI003D27202C